MTRLEDAGVRAARRLADLAAGAWREHTGQAPDGTVPCVQCYAASRRNRDALCATGKRLEREHRQAASGLAAERAAAAAPNPDQGALFDLAGLGAAAGQ